MQLTPEFPANRRDDPRRRAEAEIYDWLVNSDLPGQGIYEFSPHSAAPQLDFGLWITNLGRFGLQVKGGRYSVENGTWHLQTDRGPQPVACPVKQTWDASIAIRNAIRERLSRKVFVVAILLFPDMAPDEEVRRLASVSENKVLVKFGNDNLAGFLRQAAADMKVNYPPTDRQVDAEVAVFTGGNPGQPEPAAPPAEEATAPPAAPSQVVVENLTVHNLILCLSPEDIRQSFAVPLRKEE